MNKTKQEAKDKTALKWIEFFKESDPTEDLKRFKKFAEENPSLASSIIFENIMIISNKYPDKERLFLAQLCIRNSGYNYDYDRLLNIYNTQAIEKSQNWNYHQWRSFFVDPNRPKGEQIFENFEKFAQHNPSEAKEILDSYGSSPDLGKEEKIILNKIKNSLGTSHSNRDSGPTRLLHAADTSAPRVLAKPDVQDWDQSDWEEYFKNPHDGPDLYFAAANFHLFAERIGKLDARKFLKKIKKRNFSKQGKNFLMELRINPQKQFIEPANIPVKNPNPSSQTPIPPIAQTKKEPSAKDISSWGQEQWIIYITNLKSKDGTETLRKFVDFVHADPESARTVLEKVEYKKLSFQQQLVLNTLCERFLKPRISSEKPKFAQLGEQTFESNNSPDPDLTKVIESNSPAPTIPQTEEGWRLYFRKLDKNYPSDQFKKDMEAFKLFANNNREAAASAAVAIYDKGELAYNNPRLIAIRKALGVENPEIDPSSFVKPKKSVPANPESVDLGVLAQDQSSLPNNQEPPEDNSHEPSEETFDTNEQNQSIFEKPKSAFDEKINNLVNELSLALYHAETQALDIKDGSPFKSAKLSAIKNILEDSHPKLTTLTAALKTLQGEVLNDTDKYQLRELADDFNFLHQYTDNDDKESIKESLTVIKGLIGEKTKKKKSSSLYDTSLTLEPSSDTQNPPEKDRKESIELIQELKQVIINAVDQRSELTVDDKINLRTWLTDTFRELEKLADEDNFFPKEFELDGENIEIDHEDRINILKFYASILGLIQSRQVVSLASKDNNDEQQLKSIIEQRVNSINRNLSGKINEINWSENNQLKENFKEAFLAPYKLI